MAKEHSNLTLTQCVDQVIDVTDWQYVYGNGANGLKPTTAAAAYDAGNSSWGAKLDGSNVVQFDGVARPYSAQKGNIDAFYRTGSTLTIPFPLVRHLMAVMSGSLVSNLMNNSVVPNSGLGQEQLQLLFQFQCNQKTDD